MNYNKEERKKEDDLILEKLLALPQKSLEARITQLEKDIIKRQDLSDRALTKLSTKQRHLKDELFRQRYLIMFTKTLDLHHQIWQLETQIIREEHSCFQDLIYLKEKLAQLRLEFDMTELKFNLIK